jgi:hypothetical protein
MKGMELPINTLIILVIAVIVLIAVISVFYPTWHIGIGASSAETAKSAACQKLIDSNCIRDTNNIVIDDFDADKDEKIDPGTNWAWTAECKPESGSTNSWGDNLAALCKCYYQVADEAACQKLCNC